jgi:tetratricopeptide (TPR) repeat protein
MHYLVFTICVCVATCCCVHVGYCDNGDTAQVDESDFAISKLNEAIKVLPDSPELYSARARVWRKKRQYDKALVDFSEAIRLGGGADVFEDRGGVWFQKGDYKRAIADFDTAIRKGNEEFSVFGNRGLAYMKLEMWDNAYADAKEAIRRNPQWATGYVMRSNIELMNGRTNLALADLDAFICLDSKSWRAYSISAKLRSTSEDAELRNGELAVEHGTRACELTKWNNGDALESLATALAEVDRFGDAQARLQQAIDLSPTEKISMRQAMLVEFRNGMPHRAQYRGIGVGEKQE